MSTLGVSPFGHHEPGCAPKKVAQHASLKMETMGSCVYHYRKHPIVYSLEGTSNVKELA